MTGRWRTAMRRALGVDGGTSGVPMLLALSDERPHPALGAASGDGPAVAAALDSCRAELAPSAREDDLGIVTTVLATAARDES